jgi:hypothetical protein
MKRGIYKILIFCLLFIIGGFLNTSTIRAASANIEFTADESQVIVGDTVYVYINISSDAMFGDVEANLTYDEDILEYKSGVSFIKGSSGFLKIADINFSEGADNRKYALEFQALKVGKSEIEFSGQVMVYDYESALPMSVFSDSLELEVRAAHAASDNARLGSLKISPTELSPAFDKNILEYSTSVGNDIDKLVVVALPEDENATIRVVGNDFLEEGENKVIITVIAESGSDIEYTIDVIRDSIPEEGVDINPITPDEKHGSFEVVRAGDEIFAIYGGKYKIIDSNSDVIIPSGYTKTRIIISGISIPVFTPEQLDSEFLLIYAENELGETGFYRYDKAEKTMQRYVTELAPIYDSVKEVDEELMNSKQYRSNLNKAAIIIALLSVLCALFIILSIRLYLKTK